MLSITDNGLRIFPKQRMIPAKKPKTFILFPFELHFKRRESFEIKEAESLRLIKGHLETFKKCYVATSHGNDSLVMVHLIWRVCQELGIPMIDVWLNDTLNTYKEEKSFWTEFNQWLGIEDKFKVFTPPEDKNGNKYTVWSVAEMVGHLPNFRRTARTKDISYKKTNIPECCDFLKKKSIKNYLKQQPTSERYDCHFIGTRADESQIRSLGVLQRCRSYLIKSRMPYPIRAVTPLSFWKAVDVLEYFHRYNLPRNPTYSVHNLTRMGCASCPAHQGWEERLAKDPTSQGFGMLKKNLSILKDTEPKRFLESIRTLEKYLKTTKSGQEITDSNRLRVIQLMKNFTNYTTLLDYS